MRASCEYSSMDVCDGDTDVFMVFMHAINVL